MTTLLLEALRETDHLAAFINSRDRRSNPSMDRFDLGKIALSLRLLLKLLRTLRQHPKSDLYVPISQSRWGLLRDGVFLFAARTMRRRRIVHLHGGNLARVLDDSPFVRRFLVSATRGNTVGWVLTSSLSPQLRHLVDAGSIHVLENAVREPEAPPHPAETASGQVKLVFLSNLRPGKGHDLFLSALEQMHPDRARFHVRLAGEGSNDVVMSVTQRTAALEATGWNVRYLGSVTPSERWALLAWADMLVMPTQYRYEGQPLVILEALASRCAIITTAHGGIPDTIEDGREGRLVAPVTASLIAAIREMASESANLREAQRAARRRYEDRYTPEAFTARVGELTGALDSPQRD